VLEFRHLGKVEALQQVTALKLERLLGLLPCTAASKHATSHHSRSKSTPTSSSPRVTMLCSPRERRSM
jgi:hypothetical protein